MDSAPGALLIALRGPGRRAAQSALESLGYQVRTAAEPFEGTARFVEAPADLVVLSLAAFRSQDLPFLAAVRRRAPNTRVVLLVPEGRRSAARKALRGGADAWIPDPFYPEELQALVKGLLPPIEPGLDLHGKAGRAVQQLSTEIAHAVNNPLQVLRLLVEEQALAKKTSGGLLEQIDRIRDAILILERFSSLDRPAHVEGRLGPLVREALQEVHALGLVEPVEPQPSDGPPTAFDPVQIRYAVDCLLRFMAGVSEQKPVHVRAGIHRLTPSQGRGLGKELRRAVKAGRFLEVAFQGRALHVEPTVLELYEQQVIASDEITRGAHPGLAATSLVARQHAGRLLARQNEGGLVLGIALPLP